MTNKQMQQADFRATFSGYGHYKISCLCYGKSHYIITSCMPDIDKFHSDNERKSNAARKGMIKQIRADYKKSLNNK